MNDIRARGWRPVALHGGPWLIVPWNLCSPNQNWSVPSFRYNNFGLRCVREIKR